MQTESILINGLNDQQAAERVLSALQDVWGVRQVEVNVAKSEVVISYDEQAASIQDFKQAVVDVGFGLEES